MPAAWLWNPHYWFFCWSLYRYIPTELLLLLYVCVCVCLQSAVVACINWLDGTSGRKRKTWWALRWQAVIVVSLLLYAMSLIWIMTVNIWSELSNTMQFYPPSPSNSAFHNTHIVHVENEYHTYEKGRHTYNICT